MGNNMPRRGKPERIEPRKTPQQDRSIQRVHAILESATRLITQSGVSALTMTALAKEAGVPIGSIYQYFPEKAAILRALFDMISARVEEHIIHSLEKATTLDELKEHVFVLIDWYYRECCENPIYLSIWLSMEMDKALAQLNIEQSYRLAEVFIYYTAPLRTPRPGEDYEARCKLLSYFLGSCMRLALLSEQDHAKRMLLECKRLIRESI
jgi:AcrR family transcriptional regulator